MTIIDFWLLGRLEKFAHWWQKLAGKNCFWLARAAVVCYGLLIVAILVPSILYGKNLVAVTMPVILIVAAFFTVFHHFKMIKYKERIVSGMQEAGLSNPFKIIDSDWRTVALLIIFLCMLAVVVNSVTGGSVSGYFISIMLGFLVFLDGLSYYFSACDPLPPAKSKIKEWKEKSVNAVKGVFAPAPQPSPVPCE